MQDTILVRCWFDIGPIYFWLFGLKLRIILLPSRFGTLSGFPYSARSLAKRASRSSPYSLKTMERPRKKT